MAKILKGKAAMDVVEVPTLLRACKPTSYEELLTDILRQIVDHPEDLEVVELDDVPALHFEITANKADHGQIIGKQGATIGALHKILIAISRGSRVVLDIKNNSKGVHHE